MQGQKCFIVELSVLDSFSSKSFQLEFEGILRLENLCK